THLTLIDKKQTPKKASPHYKHLLTLSQKNPTLYSYALQKLLTIKGEAPQIIATLATQVLTLNSQNAKLIAQVATLEKEVAALKQKISPPIISSSSSSSSSNTTKLPEGAIGKAIWEKHFKSVKGTEDPLPSNIEAILNAPSPYKVEGYCGKVRDTHILVWIPERVPDKIYGVDVSLNGLSKIFNFKIQLSNRDWGDTAARTIDKSRWFLMSKNIISGTKGWKRKKQVPMVRKQGFSTPSALYVVAALSIYRKETKKVLACNTFCSQETSNYQQLVVYAGSKGGGLIGSVDRYRHSYFDSIRNIGMVGMRILD
ncbi:hypothetical protein, partial [Candidatus Neptunochlamydia vexilliferae]